ncbi:MAG: T9SS type A sorting domain-containing protein, partial [Bacteroidota bacterium]
ASSLPTAGQVWEVCVVGSYLYFPESYVGLRIYNISNPSSPVQMGTFNLSDGFFIGVFNNLAYVSNFSYGMEIINVTNPSNPVHAGSFRTPGWSTGIALKDNYAYLSAGTAGMQILNISNPAAPLKVAFDSTTNGSLTISGNYLYATNNGNGVKIMSLSNPLLPAQVGLITTPGSALKVQVSGIYAYIADGSDGLRIVNISNPASPFEVSFLDTPGYVADVAIQGTKAYIHDVFEGIKIIDIANPLLPTLIGSLAISGQGGGGVAVSGNYLYFANNYQGLQIIDVSNPASPVQVSSYYCWAAGITLAGMYAYVPQSTTSLLILNISNPLTPSLLGYYPIPGQMETDVFFRNAFLYTPDEFAGMEIIAVPPVVTISGQNTACLGSTGNIYSTETGNTNYTWTISAGGTITSGCGTSSIVVTWNTTGAQSVSVNYSTAYNYSAPVATQFQVQVIPAPVPIISGPAFVCADSIGVPYQTEQGMTGYTWAVSSGGSIISGAGTSTLTVAWTSTGSQTVSVNYTTPAGCTAAVPTVFPVDASPLPAAPGIITGSPELCAGTNGVAYSVLPVAFASSYQWTIPPGCTITSGAGTNNITIDFSPSATSGDIFVAGVNQCGEGVLSPAYFVLVNPIPAPPVVVLVVDTLTSSYPSGNQWYFEGTLIPGATGQSLVATQNGVYWAIVTLNNCPSDTSNNVNFSLTGVSASQEAFIVVYPVPNNGHFTLSTKGVHEGNVRLTVLDMQGKIVYRQEMLGNELLNEFDLDIRPVANGLYTLLIDTRKGHFSKRILIGK